MLSTGLLEVFVDIEELESQFGLELVLFSRRHQFQVFEVAWFHSKGLVNELLFFLHRPGELGRFLLANYSLEISFQGLGKHSGVLGWKLLSGEGRRGKIGLATPLAQGCFAAFSGGL